MQIVKESLRVLCQRMKEGQTLAMKSGIRWKSNDDDYLPERVVIIYRSTASNLQTQRGVPIRDATMVPLSRWKTLVSRHGGESDRARI